MIPYLFGSDTLFIGSFLILRMTTNSVLSIIWVLPFLHNPKYLDLSYKTDLDFCNLKYLDLSYKTDLDFGDYFGRKKLSYNRRSKVVPILLPLGFAHNLQFSPCPLPLSDISRCSHYYPVLLLLHMVGCGSVFYVFSPMMVTLRAKYLDLTVKNKYNIIWTHLFKTDRLNIFYYL